MTDWTDRGLWMPRKKTGPSDKKPLGGYEQFMDKISELYPTMSSGFQQIARFVIQNPNYVAMNSVNTIAKASGSHASSVVRFAQACGFAGYRELQAVFQLRLSTTTTSYQERLRDLDLNPRTGESGRNRGMLREVTERAVLGLEELVATVSEDALARAAELLLKARTVYISGQMESAGVAHLLHYLLVKLGRRVVLLDAPGGLAVEMANAMTTEDVLVAISFRYYAKEVVTISGTAYRTLTPTIVITDSALSPLARNVEVVFVVAQDEPTLTPSLAAPVAVAQALALCLAARLKEQPPEKPVAKTRTPWRE